MRPNAKINAVRKAKADRKVGPPSLPPVVMSRIAEAGASAYQWRDNVLLDLYLPPKSVQVGVSVGFWVIQALTAAAVAYIALKDGLSLALVALAIPAAASGLSFLIRKAPSAPPAISWVAASAIAAIPMISSASTWGLLGVVALVLAAIVSAEREHPIRAGISAWVSTILTLTFSALAYAQDLAPGAAIAWVLSLIVLQVPICITRRSFKTIVHRISRDDLTARIPPPEFKWEPLAAFVRRAATAPGVSLLASAFSSSSWIEGVLEGPSEAVLGDALKKSAGGYGERKTGVFLLALDRGQGTLVLHDVVLPGAKSANIDHIVIGRNRGGEPCAFIIDSKFYGFSRLNGNDPGEVTYDMGTRGYVHRQGARAREIDQSIKTALWGADSVRKVTGIEDVRVIMAIHNADVAPNLAFEREGVPVQIISAWSLVDFIGSNLSDRKSWLMSLFRRGGGPLSPLQEARVTQGLVSASTSLRPAVVSPLGATEQARDFMAAQALQARGGGAGAPGQFGRPSLRPYEDAPRVPEVVPQAPRGPVLPPQPASAPRAEARQESAFQKADRAFFDGDVSEWADDSPPRPPVAPAESATDRIADLWAQMRNSTPAPLDDVPAQYHQIVRGTPLTITSFSDERGPSSQDVVAITGVCVGMPGNLFLWHCSVEGWEQYRQSGTSVSISTIDVERVVVRGGE